MQAVCETTHPLYDLEWLVVPRDQPTMALQSLRALMVMEEAEKDPITHLIFGFLLVSIDVLLYMSYGVGKGFSHIFQ